MARTPSPMSTERFFRLGISLKGLHAVLEIVGGVALLLVSPAYVIELVELFTQDELREDPRDLIANTLLDAAQHLSLGGKLFGALYLLSHGVVKLVLVAALLRNRPWAYPAALAVFGAFIVYQLYRFSFTHSVGLVALTLFDLVVMWLIWREYRIQARRRLPNH